MRSAYSRQKNKVARFLLWVAFDAHIETIELWTALYAIIWGAWLFNPWMDVFSNAVVFTTMARVPEVIWGFMFMTAGTLQLWGRLNGHPRVIRYGARTIAGLWMFGAAAIAWQNWRWDSIVLYPMLALASVFVSFRAINPSPSQPIVRREWEAEYGGSS